MLNLKPIALVGGTVVCAVGFLLFIPLITEIFYQSESWQSYAVPILIYLIVGGSLVITNRNIELKISMKEAFNGNNDLHGISEAYHQNGQLKSKVEYKNGTLINTIEEYDFNGNRIN